MDWAGIDEWIYRRLTELVDVLPMRFVKLVATVCVSEQSVFLCQSRSNDSRRK